MQCRPYIPSTVQTYTANLLYICIYKTRNDVTSIQEMMSIVAVCAATEMFAIVYI